MTVCPAVLPHRCGSDGCEEAHPRRLKAWSGTVSCCRRPRLSCKGLQELWASCAGKVLLQALLHQRTLNSRSHRGNIPGAILWGAFSVQLGRAPGTPAALPMNVLQQARKEAAMQWLISCQSLNNRLPSKAVRQHQSEDRCQTRFMVCKSSSAQEAQVDCDGSSTPR